MQLVYTSLCFIIACAIQILVSGRVGTTYSAGDPPAAGSNCTQATNCGNGGCCLHGVCSFTGGTGAKCYMNVSANGIARPSGIWNETDLCPCTWADYCWEANTDDTDPKYGRTGFCTSL